MHTKTELEITVLLANCNATPHFLIKFAHLIIRSLVPVYSSFKVFDASRGCLHEYQESPTWTLICLGSALVSLEELDEKELRK